MFESCYQNQICKTFIIFTSCQWNMVFKYHVVERYSSWTWIWSWNKGSCCMSYYVLTESIEFMVYLLLIKNFDDSWYMFEYILLFQTNSVTEDFSVDDRYHPTLPIRVSALLLSQSTGAWNITGLWHCLQVIDVASKCVIALLSIYCGFGIRLLMNHYVFIDLQ